MNTLLVFLFSVKTSFFRLFEWLTVVWLYYRREMVFFWVDFLLARHYLFKSPHRVSKAFMKAEGAANIYAYGETPMTTIDQIARECHILSHDRVYELGCGSGRSCFWLHLFVKCHVIGVDHLPDFIEKAEKVKKRMRLSGIQFVRNDMRQVDLNQATVIYLYGTCLDEKTIEGAYPPLPLSSSRAQK